MSDEQDTKPEDTKPEGEQITIRVRDQVSHFFVITVLLPTLASKGPDYAVSIAIIILIKNVDTEIT
eukprot:scaffold671_cov286-Chaetoceros_neogracile.AAC.16